MNIGTIIEAATVTVRMARGGARQARHAAAGGGRRLGEIEEDFAETLTPGDTFLFAGEVLRFEGLKEDEALVTAGRPAATRRSRATPARSSRSRPSSPPGCGR